MVEICWKKCITKYSEPELAVGESICVDRCVVKYLEMYEKLRYVVS